MTFHSLSRFLRDSFSAPAHSAPKDPQEGLRTATAAVLLEIAYADDSLSMAEESKLLEYFQTTFDLSPERARELVEAGEQLRQQTIDHFALTNFLRQNTTREQRLEIVRTMWRLVYADGSLHEYETYLVRKLADLLGLEHSVMIEVKLAVRAEMG